MAKGMDHSDHIISVSEVVVSWLYTYLLVARRRVWVGKVSK